MPQIMEKHYKPKDRFDSYVASTRDFLKKKQSDKAVEDMLCALEELQTRMEEVDARLRAE